MKTLNQIEHRRADADISVSQTPLAIRTRATRSVAQEASVVSLRSAAKVPWLYGPNGIVGRNAPAAAPDLMSQLRQRLKDEYPDLRQEAKRAVEASLRNRYGIHVDADQTWFNTFSGAASSSRSYNGWEHTGKPLVSLSLTDLQLQNFPADFGEDPNGLNANSGVYRAGAGATRFDDENEVRLLASDLKAAIRGSDFQSAYRTKLEAYWQRNENAVALNYEALVLQHLQDGSLSAEARTLLTQVAAYHNVDNPNRGVYIFDINSYPSKNMTWLQAADGRVVLLTPHGAKPLREYASVGEMRRGITELVRTEAGRDEILRGFSLYNQQDGIIYQGIEKWLGDIAAGGYDDRIAMRPQRIEGKLFADMAHRSRAAALDDVSRLIRSNSDVGKKEVLQALRALNEIVGNPLTELAEAGYALYAASSDGLLEDRRDAASKAWVAGLNSAVMVLLDGAGRYLAKPDLPAPKMYYKPPSRLPDGRVGYPLGPVDVPGLPDEEGIAGPSGSRSPSPPMNLQRTNRLAIEHPVPGQAPDLGRARMVHRYREPEGRFNAPRTDMPEPVVSDGQMDEPLDLSNTTARPALDEPVHAGASGVVGQANLVDPVLPRQINALGFRERYDFQNLYGFQPFGGARSARTVGGIELNRNSVGVTQMIDGDMLRTFRTVEAAEAAARRAPLQHYRIYQIRANGLRAASFQDNRLNNPLFESLRLPLTSLADSIAQPRQRTMMRTQLLENAEQEVHLSTEFLNQERVMFIFTRTGRN